MPSQLNRVEPQTDRHRAQIAAEAAAVAKMKLRVDQPDQTSAKKNAAANREIAQLKQLRNSLQELIHLKNAQLNLPRTKHGYAPANSAARFETRRLLNQIADLLGDSNTSSPPPAGRRVSLSAKRQAKQFRKQVEQSATADRRLVKVKLPAETVQLLEACRKSGVDPAELIEKSLWSNASVVDAARIIGVKRQPAATTR